jgi:hypothetical protein
VKLTTHLHLVPTTRMTELYITSTVHLDEVVLNQLSTGTNLPFCLSSFIKAQM